MPTVVTAAPSSSTTVNDLIRTLPLICHGYFRFALLTLTEKSSRYFSAKHAREEFMRMKELGQIPASINSLRTPTLQISSEYKQDHAHPEYNQIEQITQQARVQILDQFAKAKKEEYDFYWKSYVSPTAIKAVMKKEWGRMVAGLCVTYGCENAKQLPENVRDDINSCEEALEAVGLQVVEMCRVKTLSSYDKAREKKRKKSAADVEMSGVSGEINEKTLEKHVESVIKRREQSRRDQTRAKSKGSANKKDKSKKTIQKTAKRPAKGSPVNAKPSKKPRKS